MDDIKTPEQLLEFMTNNISYGYLGKNERVYHSDDLDFNLSWFNEYVLENNEDVLKNLCGTCWDQVEFERYWFLKSGYEIKTYYEMIYLDYDNNYPTHSFLIYKDGDSWCWFENSDIDNRGIQRFKTIDELLKYQQDKYISNLKNYSISDEELKKLIIKEFDKPNEHISAGEYIDFVLGN